MAAPYADSSESSGVVQAESPFGQHETLEMRAEDIKAKLKVAVRQLSLFNQHLRRMKRLRKRAKRERKYYFLATICVNIAILTELKFIYCHYANAKVLELRQVYKQMEEEGERAVAGDRSGGDRVRR